jgi:hypothetical protein
MDPFNLLGYLILGGFLGMVGQGIRVFVGIKKVHDKQEVKDGSKKLSDLLDGKRLGLSLMYAFIIGTIAGVLGVVNYLGKELSTEHIFALIGAGYAGTDFIEGVFYRKI